MFFGDCFSDPTNYTILDQLSHPTSKYHVFKGYSNETGQYVAIKDIFPPNQKKFDQRLFLNGAEQLFRLKHPSILSMIALILPDHINPNPQIVVPYLNEPRLSEILENPEKPEWWNATTKMKLIYGIAAAMQYTHSQDINFPKLNPHNIAIGFNNNPILMDVGFPQFHNPEYPDSMYISPEVKAGNSPDKSSDIYAYGVIAYMILTDGQGSIDPITTIPNLSIIFDVIISRCLNQTPSLRITFDEILVLFDTRSFYLPGTNFNAFTQFKAQLDNYNIPKVLSPEEEFKHVKKLADNGDCIYQAICGQKYELGQGVKASYTEAARYYKMSADANNAKGQYFYGRLCKNGWGVKQDYKEAFNYYTLSAKQNYAFAQNNLGVLYESGYGCEINKKKAAKWYKKAADQLDDMGQCNYARLLKKGYGVSKNPSLSAKYYKLSAKQGNSIAQYQYAKVMEEGKIVNQNIIKAVKYYNKAAKGGYKLAEKDLARLADLGCDVQV